MEVDMVSAPYISLEKESQAYHNKNILLNLETIFKIDNKKTDAWRAGQASTHQLRKMTSIKIGIKLDLKLIAIFWIDNQKLGVLNNEYE
jgi:hypothetical protein